MKKNLLLFAGVIGLLAGGYFLYQYLYPGPNEPNQNDLIIGGGSFLFGLVCFAVFFFIRFREEGEQDISITKF